MSETLTLILTILLGVFFFAIMMYGFYLLIFQKNEPKKIKSDE